MAVHGSNDEEVDMIHEKDSPKIPKQWWGSIGLAQANFQTNLEWFQKAAIYGILI